MKKLIIGLVFAAALLCGCQKINDLESRMKAAESDISALKSDVAKLQAAVEGNYAISGMQQTADGYVITLTNGTTINLKNGKDGLDGKDGNDGNDGQDGKDGNDGQDGQDGDAFFESVTSEDGVVVITLIDGTVYRLPLAEDYPLKSVKSLTYIPDYLDGMATVYYFKPEEATVDMRFMIRPASASKPLMKAVEDGVLRIIPVSTQPATRSLADFVKELTYVTYSIDPDGLLTVKVNASGLDPGFFKGECGAAVAVVISDGVTEISSEFVPLTKEFTGLEYAGELYHTARMRDGKVWMTDNLRYVPEGYVPCSDITKVDAGVYNPVVMSEDKTKAVFGTAADASTQGYLYQSEVALGLKVGDIKTPEDAQALEGARGICPEGWHIPTLSDWLNLTGKSVGASTNVYAPYYDGSNGSIKLLNADGFNLYACGAVTVMNNTATSATLMGKLGKYEYITSGYVAGSSYAGSTFKDDVMTNVQFFALMPMTNKETEAEFTANGSKLNYRSAVSVRCVKD